MKKGIRGAICHVIHQYTKANNKYMKDYNKHKKSISLSIGMSIICMDGQCHKCCH